MHCIRTFATVVALGVLVTASSAGQAPKDKGRGRASNAPAANAPAPSPRASEIEVRLIREYYAGEPRHKALPPGIAKNLARGKPLPPGIARTRVPDDLRRRLPVRADHQWLILGDRVVLLDPVGLVVDLIDLVF